MRGYISNFEDLEKWFLPLGTTGWSIYHGFQKQRLNNSNLVFKNEDDSLGLEDSFERLKDMIEMNCTNGGQFTIYVPYKSNNTGVKTFFGVGLNNQGKNPQIGGIPAIYGGYEKMLEKEKKMWEMEAAIAGMEAERESKLSTTDRIIEKVMEDIDINQVVPALLGFFSQLIPKKVPITMQGITQDTVSEQPQNTVYQYHEDKILPVLNTIRQHFASDDEFYNFLNAVAQKFNEQPEVFKSMIHV